MSVFICSYVALLIELVCISWSGLVCVNGECLDWQWESWPSSDASFNIENEKAHCI